MKRVLVFEDNLRVVEVITEGIKELEEELGEIEMVDISKGREALRLAGDGEIEKFDVILLDCISADDMSFHEAVLDPPSLKLRRGKERINPEKVIAISNTPAYNQEAREAGVKKVVQKDYFDLNDFKDKIKKEIKNILNQ